MLFDKSTFNLLKTIVNNEYTLNKYPELIFIDNLLNVHFPILPTLSYICEQITDEMIINYINEYVTDKYKVNFSYIVKFIQFRNWKYYNDLKYIDLWENYIFDKFELKIIEMFKDVYNEKIEWELEKRTTAEIMKLVRKKLTHIRTYYDDDYVKHKLQKALKIDKKLTSKLISFEYNDVWTTEYYRTEHIFTYKNEKYKFSK